MFTEMAGKRPATTDLNHDNWDDEEKPEEAGTFKKAPDDVMEKRIVKKAKRRLQNTEVNIFIPISFILQYVYITLFKIFFRTLLEVHLVHLQVLKQQLQQMLRHLAF